MGGKVSFVFLDNSNEKSTVSLNLPVITGANYDDVTGNAVGENVGDLRIALGIASLANYVNTVVTAVSYPEDDPVPPSDPFAQRETGLRVFYSAGGKRYHITIPAPDLALYAQTGTDVVDHTGNVAAIALVNALEANAADPNGDPITVTGIRIVGRAS